MRSVDDVRTFGFCDVPYIGSIIIGIVCVVEVVVVNEVVVTGIGQLDAIPVVVRCSVVSKHIVAG